MYLYTCCQLIGMYLKLLTEPCFYSIHLIFYQFIGFSIIFQASLAILRTISGMYEMRGLDLQIFKNYGSNSKFMAGKLHNISNLDQRQLLEEKFTQCLCALI